MDVIRIWRAAAECCVEIDQLTRKATSLKIKMVGGSRHFAFIRSFKFRI